MEKQKQKRTLATRAKLIEAAQKSISSKGFEAMRVEEVVKAAGVAKGTFFTHFRDKDAVMELLIGGEIDLYLDGFEGLPPPENMEVLICRFLPLMQFMTSERYIFDVILRHSGAATKEETGPISRTFCRQITVLTQWLSDGPFRKDVPPLILAEGVQAFAVQCMALHFCAINNVEPMEARLGMYLDAWLCPHSS